MNTNDLSIPPYARLVGRLLTKKWGTGRKAQATYRILAANGRETRLFIEDAGRPGCYAIVGVNDVTLRAASRPAAVGLVVGSIHPDCLWFYSPAEKTLRCQGCGCWYGMRRPLLSLELRTDNTAVVKPGFVETCTRCWHEHTAGTVMEVGR